MERNDKEKNKLWKHEISEKVSKKDTSNIDRLVSVMKKNDTEAQNKQKK